jgi:hypothetical protein
MSPTLGKLFRHGLQLLAGQDLLLPIRRVLELLQPLRQFWWKSRQPRSIDQPDADHVLDMTTHSKIIKWGLETSK